MTYGQTGLISFLKTLFGPCEKDDKTEGCNFYWQLEEMMHRLENYEPDVPSDRPIYKDYCAVRQKDYDEN